MNESWCSEFPQLVSLQFLQDQFWPAFSKVIPGRLTAVCLWNTYNTGQCCMTTLMLTLGRLKLRGRGNGTPSPGYGEHPSFPEGSEQFLVTVMCLYEESACISLSRTLTNSRFSGSVSQALDETPKCTLQFTEKWKVFRHRIKIRDNFSSSTETSHLPAA